jgi:hypothetical protein
MASVNTNGITSPYVRSTTSFSGSDINLVLGNILLGQASGLSYSITREKAPVFVLGNPSPMSFSRNKRGIAGSLSMTIFDRSGFFDIMQNSLYASKRWDVVAGGQSFQRTPAGTWADSTGSGVELPEGVGDEYSARNPIIGGNGAISGGTGLELKMPNYVDQLPPFDLSLTGRNEVGTAASMVLYGTEIVNEGSSHGLNDVGFEANYTFVARDMVPWTPAQYDAVVRDDMATEFAPLRSSDEGVGR